MKDFILLRESAKKKLDALKCEIEKATKVKPTYSDTIDLMDELAQKNKKTVAIITVKNKFLIKKIEKEIKQEHG
jgi:hypothetical protein